MPSGILYVISITTAPSAAPGASAPTGTSVALWTIDAQNEALILNQVAQQTVSSVVTNAAAVSQNNNNNE